MKKVLSLSGIALATVILAGCTSSNTPAVDTSSKQNNTQSNTETMTVTPSPEVEAMTADSTPASSESAMASGTTQAGVKEINLESFSFGFTPNKIEVNKGDKVRINVKNTGGFHDFTLTDFNIKVTTPAGQTTPVEFTADKAGTFEFHCGVGNHAQQGQKGTLTVK